MAIAFYLIRETTDGKYYESGSFCASLENCRAHFESAANAEKEIRKRQGQGYDMDDAEIVAIELKTVRVIKPKIIKQKKGWVIEVTDPEHKGYDRYKTYYRGNKKKIYRPDSQLTIYSDLRNGREQTLTATVFETKGAADTRLKEITTAIRDVKGKHENIHNYVTWTDQQSTGWDLPYGVANKRFSFKVVPV